MVERFAFWTTNPFHPTVKTKEVYESWPITMQEPCDEVSAFARDWSMRWRDNEFFPDHPFRDRAGKIILPDSIDQTPEEYLDANEPPAPATEPDVRYPFSGPANLVRGPGANSGETIAAYERGRRGLKRMKVKPPAPPYEQPTSPASSFTPSMAPNDPKISRRVYSRDKFDPKYQRPGER